MSENNTEFYTLKGYRLHDNDVITDAMEDYLEMICRCAEQEGYVRINHLAQQLHVRPSSASKMVGKLRELGLVSFERYGLITPTPEGAAVGGTLLRRHELLHRFFCLLNHSENELQQVEQVEHFIQPHTLCNLEHLVRRLEEEERDSRQD